MSDRGRDTQNRAVARGDAGGPGAGRSRLTEAELETVPAAGQFAESHGIGRGTEAEYVARLPEARWEISSRLIACLVQETPPFLPGCVVSPAGGVSATLTAGAFPSAAVRDRVAGWVETRTDAAAPVAVLPFPDAGAAVVVSVTGVRGFGRPELAPPAASITATSTDRVDHPVEIADLLAAEGAFPDEAHADWFRRWIDQSVANLALARLGERRLAPAFDRLMDGFGASPGSATRADDPSVQLERLAAVRGHPTHPGGKACLGVAPTDALRYQPEFADAVELRFVAVAGDRTVASSTAGRPTLTERCLACFEGLAGAVEDSLPPGASLAAYDVLPVHPWQYDNVLPDLRLDDGSVVPVEGYTHPASPLASFRTLAPHGSHRGRPLPRVKLSVSAFKQGHRRLLPLAAVHDGPRLTELLDAILDGGRFERMGVLGESAGACYRPRGSGAAAEPGTLSALLRSPPSEHRLVGDDRVAVPAAGLLADRPVGPGTVAGRIVERYAGASDAPAAALEFLADYAGCVVPGSLRLLCRYGIGLEVHSQNTLVVLDGDGRPSGALVRDFSGVRIDAGRLDGTPHEVDLHPDSPVDADERELYETYYALFQRQLGDLIVALAGDVGVEERACWRVVRRVCEAAFADLRADPAVPGDRVDRDEAVLFASTVDGWALLTRRVLGRRDPMYYPAPNPLADAG